MKTLYFECNMGAAGDMLMAALLELTDDSTKFLEKINSLGLSGVRVSAQLENKCGINGTKMTVLINGEEEGHHHHHDHHDHCDDDHHHHDHHHHSHSQVKDIKLIIDSLNVSDNVKKHSLEVYNIIAEGESAVHGIPVEQIHFHEVGNMDAIVDIVGACMLLEELEVDKIVASPIHVGSGQVHCAHGILPVPAPATAYILKNVPIYGGQVKGELCTPTGAALLKHFAMEFGSMPIMKVEKIGYGMGTKNFDAANCIRAMLGETEDCGEEVVEIACNLDDMTGENIGFAMEILMENGALDVYTTPIGMKKSRPATMLTCMCNFQDRQTMTKLIFKHTTTLGVREYRCNRHTLSRNMRTVETQYGSVRVKESEGFSVKKQKAEYDDIAKIAKENNLSIKEVENILEI